MHEAHCQCEHSDHFESSDGEKAHAHAYGERCMVETVKTDYGHFDVCQECRDGHWKEVIRVVSSTGETFDVEVE